MTERGEAGVKEASQAVAGPKPCRGAPGGWRRGARRLSQGALVRPAGWDEGGSKLDAFRVSGLESRFSGPGMKKEGMNFGRRW